MKGIIYKYTCPQGKCYIGQTTRELTRRDSHRFDTVKLDTKFGRALRDIGYDNFQYEVLCECDEVELDKMERYYIKMFDSCRNGYNTEKGGFSLKAKANINNALSELGNICGETISTDNIKRLVESKVFETEEAKALIDIIGEGLKTYKSISECGTMMKIGEEDKFYILVNKVYDENYLLVYLTRLCIANTCSKTNFVKSTQRTYVDGWSSLYDVLYVKKNSYKSDLRKFLLDNDIIRIINVEGVKRFVVNPFIINRGNQVNMKALSVFSDYLRVPYNISANNYIYLELAEGTKQDPKIYYKEN